MKFEAFIDAPDFYFRADQDKINTLYFFIIFQQNIQFLPILLHESFPLLKEYYVTNTAVPKISKKNFEKLFKLEMLSLDENQIEVIRSDTFEDLISLKEIKISKKQNYWSRFTLQPERFTDY